MGAIEHIQRLSQDNELSTALSDLLVEVFSTASNAGHAADEMPVLFELLKRGRP